MMATTNFDENLINVSKASNLINQSIGGQMSAEKTESFFGAQSIGQISIGVLRANQIITGLMQGVNGNVFFDLDNSKIQLTDGTNPRIVIDGLNTKFVISKPGFNANTATPDQSVIYADATTTKIYFAQVFPAPSTYAADLSQVPVGYIAYDTTNTKNACSTITFYKQSNWTISKATFNMTFSPGRKDNGAAFVNCYPQAVRVRINPTSTVTAENHGLGYPGYIRYSSGTVLTMDGVGGDSVTPTDGTHTYTDTLSGSEISQFANGVNTIVVQADTSSTLDYGICACSLYIEGSVTIT